MTKLTKTGKFRKNSRIILYHGLIGSRHARKINQEGLRGGYNQFGGNHGTWDHPILFTTPDLWVARKYATICMREKGYIFTIDLSGSWVNEHMPEIINDGLGDRCWVWEGDGILIPSEYISCSKLEKELREERLAEINKNWD